MNRIDLKPEMTSSSLLELLHLLDEAEVVSWLDGGWGVDALLETQTRPHKDVDIIVTVADTPKLREILSLQGFALREGAPPNSFVLANGNDLEVDVHAVVFNHEGAGIYRMENGKDWVFPAEGFGGRGKIDGKTVRCLSPISQVLCHAQGYVPVEKDFQDMELLQRQFRVELPPQLRRPPV